MCELLGVSSLRPSGFGDRLAHLAEGGKENPDGWGIAAFDGPAAAVIKEPVPIRESALGRFFLEHPDAIRSRILLAHLRESSGTGVRLANTHPFERELGGQTFVFVHNGTLRGRDEALRLSGRFLPSGDTDSERAFCHLMERLAAGARLDRTFLAEWASEVGRLGRLNFLLADGEALWAYRGIDGNTVHVASEAGARRAVVATAARGAGPWRALKEGELLRLRDGSVT